MTVKRPLGAGDGIKIERNLISIDGETIDHDSLLNYVENEHIDWTNSEEDFFTSGSVTIGGSINFNSDLVRVSTISYTVTQDHDFTVGNVIYMYNNDFKLASCVSEQSSDSIGIIIEVDEDSFTFAIAGYVTLDYTSLSLSPNTVYYLSSVEGEVTDSKPTTEGFVSKPVLRTTRDNKAVILQERGIVLETIIDQHVDTDSDVKHKTLNITGDATFEGKAIFGSSTEFITEGEW